MVEIIIRIKKKRKGTSFFPLRLINLRKIGSVFNVSAISLGLSFVEGVEFVGKIKRERERDLSFRIFNNRVNRMYPSFPFDPLFKFLIKISAEIQTYGRVKVERNRKSVDLDDVINFSSGGHPHAGR